MNENDNKNKILSKEEIENQIKEFLKNLEEINININDEKNKEDKSEDKINSLKKLKSDLINAINYYKKQLNEINKKNEKDIKKFIIPNNLKLNPTDTKDIKLLKRKKVKKLKYQFKEKEIDKNSEIIKNNWENFNKNLKNKKNNKTLNGYNPMKLINNKK
jgi:hypothetical protein